MSSGSAVWPTATLRRLSLAAVCASAEHCGVAVSPPSSSASTRLRNPAIAVYSVLFFASQLLDPLLCFPGDIYRALKLAYIAASNACRCHFHQGLPLALWQCIVMRECTFPLLPLPSVWLLLPWCLAPPLVALVRTSLGIHHTLALHRCCCLWTVSFVCCRAVLTMKCPAEPRGSEAENGVLGEGPSQLLQDDSQRIGPCVVESWLYASAGEPVYASWVKQDVVLWLRMRGSYTSGATAIGALRSYSEPYNTYTYIYIYGWLSKYGPFLGTLNIRCRIIIGIQTRTIILTATHI